MADKTKYYAYDTVKEMLYDLEFEGKEVEPSDYPYIEIADEHGRCIDADILSKRLIKWEEEALLDMDIVRASAYRNVRDILNKSAVVLEAIE